jgi:hypothetical protein
MLQNQRPHMNFDKEKKVPRTTKPEGQLQCSRITFWVSLSSGYGYASMVSAGTSWTATSPTLHVTNKLQVEPQSFQHIWSNDKPIIQLLYYFNTGAKYQESVETLPSLTGSMWYESKEGLSQPYQWLKLKMRLILEDIQSIHYPLQTNVRAK